MSSFTDSPQVFIPQGAPLVDLNLYDQSLTHKDIQYDKGVQRVQNAYDTVAGLDVMRGIDKQYLQSKLSQLQTNIQQLAGGDFSTNSLVTQAASLAPQISRDGNVQNAVLSTQQIRSLMNSQRITKSKEPGAYGPEAEWYDNRAVNQYLSSGEIGSLYNGPTQATKLKQFDPELQKLLDKIVPAKSVVLNDAGKYQWKKETYESVTNDKIQATIDGYFAANPDAAESARIKGMYTYRNYDAPTMATTIQKSYEGNIRSLKEINSQYDNDITNNGKNADFVADRMRAKAANMQAISAMIDKVNHYESADGKSYSLTRTDQTPNLVKGKYISYLEDPSKLDDMKATLYNDNYKAMYGTVLQKDNITDRSLVENANAIHADENYWKSVNYNLEKGKFGLSVKNTQLDALKAGYKYDESGNLRPLTSSDPEYAIYLQHLKSTKTGSGANGSTNGADGHSYGDAYVGGSLSKGGTVNEGQIDANIKAATDIKNGEFSRFKENWKKANKKDDASFQSFMDQQDKLFNSGDPHINPDYALYKQSIMKSAVELQSNLQMKQDATTFAAGKVPMDNLGQTVKLTYDKKAPVDMFINPATHPEFVRDFSDIYAKVEEQSKAYEQKAGTDSKGRPLHTTAGASTRRQFAMDILESQYKSSPVYRQLKAVIESGTGMEDVNRTVLGTYREKLNERKKAENDYYATNAKAFAPWETPYGDSETDMMDVKNKAFSLLQANGFKGLGDKSFEGVAVGDVHVIGNSIDPVTENAVYHVQGKDAKGNTIDDYVMDNSPNSSSKLPGYNPYAWVNRILEVSNATPLSGDGVLHSTNGLVKFQMQKGPYGYTYSIIDGGNPVGGRRCADAADAFANIEKLSAMPSVNGGSMNAEEAKFRFTHTEKEYKEKYQTHQ